MRERRKEMAMRLLKGLITATGVTLIGMAILAALVVWARLSDEALRTGNQIVKAISVIVGTYVAVGPGGRSGLITGAIVGLVYMLLGYLLVGVLGGRVSLALAGETAMSALIGATSGVLTAQLPPRGLTRMRRAA